MEDVMRSILFISALLLTTTACVEDVGTGKTEATIVEPPATEPSEPTVAAGSALTVDASKGKVHALGAKVTAKHPIVFKDYTGAITVDGETVTAVSYEVDMRTLEADHPKLTAHLLEEDFFDVAKHPNSTFASSEIAAGSDVADMTHTVTGDLTIRGTTKRVSFPAKIAVTGTEAAASAEFVINRHDFKITYAGRADDLIQDNVVITVDLVAPRS